MNRETFLANYHIHPTSITPVHGGDINQCFCLETTGGETYFLKENQLAAFPGMFAREAEGLEALKQYSSMSVPGVVAVGNSEDAQWLLMEWLPQGKPSLYYWKHFGVALAHLHRNSHASFGWHTDNYIGSLPQPNKWSNTWAEFYYSYRIMPLVKNLFELGAFSNVDIAQAERFCTFLPELLPAESPALLHGDLWSGNCMCTQAGNAAVYDPAVYYGHREMDLAMTKLFGGFPQAFYDAYHEAFPLAPNWQKRLNVTQLYPVLVHAVLFGGSYVEAARSAMQLHL